MATMFYYPLINAPRDTVYNAVLYWDKVATVLPPGTEPYEPYLNPLMREVDAAGLYRPIVLADQQYWGWVDLREPLEVLLDQRERLPAEQRPEALAKTERLYVEKVGHDLLRELSAHDLVEIPDGDHWIETVLVSPHVQMCLLGSIARQVARFWSPETGNTSPDSLIPFTDRGDVRELAYRPTREWHERATCWEIGLDRLLPVPRQDVLLSDLLAFREQYDDERHRLMIALDVLIHDLHRNFEHSQDVFRMIQRELEAALADFTQAGRAKRINWVERSASLTLAFATAYVGTRVVPEGGWLLGVISGYAVNVASTKIRGGAHGPNPELGYLYRVHQEV